MVTAPFVGPLMKFHHMLWACVFERGHTDCQSTR